MTIRRNAACNFRYMEIELLFPAIALAFIWQEGTKEQLEMRRREGDATGHSAVKRAISQVLFVLLLAILSVEHGDDGSVVSALRKIEYGEI